jgi:diguanylate cyclase (GGDEF)-like protein/putative nucleotidyltransferase with HDIG domain
MAPVALVIVLIAVCGVSFAAALSASRGADVVDGSSRLDRLYVEAREAVAVESQTEEMYIQRPAPALRDRYNSAAAELTRVLEQLEQHGSAEDRRTARRIAELHREYLRFAARRFVAMDHGDSTASTADDARETERLYADVRAAVDGAAAKHRGAAARSIDDLRHWSDRVSVIVPVMGTVGLLLVMFFAAIMVGYRRQVRDATQREIDRLERMALADNLTGLANHRALHEALPTVEERADEVGEQCAIVALDLDGLKEVNDTRGHTCGDALIQRLAEGLLATLPVGATGYRIGGDEFVALLPGMTAAEAFEYTQELQTWLAPPSAGVRARVVDDGFEVTHVTVGVSDVGAAEGSAGLALHRADLALVEAKRMRHRGLIWSPGIEAAARTRDTSIDQRRHLATALAKAVDAKDSYTRSHCETVSQLCVLIAEQLGMPPHDIEQLRLAGLLHDVGKIGVPDAILGKPSGLTDEEYAQMQEHSTLGASIVAAAQLTEESTWVRHHHERMDGRGYPDRLVGEEIPLPSRIIFVADAFEAITSDRPYRLGRPAAEALEELRRCAGTQFDPECVAALERALAAAGSNAPAPASTVSPPVALRLVTDAAANIDAPEDGQRKAA